MEIPLKSPTLIHSDPDWFSRIAFLAVWVGLWAFSLHVPGSILGACTAFLGAIVFSRIVQADLPSARYREWYLAGTCFYLAALPWLPEAAMNYYAFMGISKVHAWVAYVVSAALLALQFPLTLWCLKYLPPGPWDRFALRVPLAWMVGEVLFYSPFPWFFGNLFLAVTPLAQTADLLGVPLVTFVAIWLSALLSAPRRGLPVIRRAALFAVIVLCLLGYEGQRAADIQRAVASAPTIHVAMIQGNDALIVDPSEDEVTKSIVRYLELSAELSPQPDVVLWPEVAHLHLIRGNAESFSPSFDTAAPPMRRPLIFAGHTSKELPDREELFYQVTALVLQPDGTLQSGYHKRKTLPLAEDVPFKETLPVLTRIFGKRFFVPGDNGDPLSITLPRGRGGVSRDPLLAATLICYEDLVPELFQKMVRDSNAQVLFSLSNGQWFGQTAAIKQHALLASWRAVENGRYLVRAATTGLTRVVDPQGRVVAELEPFREGTLRFPQLPLLNGSTLFSRLGVMPLRIVSILILLLAVMWYLRTWNNRLSGKRS